MEKSRIANYLYNKYHTDEEYREQQKENRRIWYEKNGSKLKQRVLCKCGRYVNKPYLQTHKQTQLHKNRILNKTSENTNKLTIRFVSGTLDFK